MLPALAIAFAALLGGCRSGSYSGSWNSAALDQKWSSATAEHYWWTSQGSQILPYDYFLALELAGSTELFSSNAHFERLRYVTVPAKSSRNPGGLAIGFVKNEEKMEGLEILGMTCAACHTGKWKINGVDVQIEGGSSKGDTQTFLEEMIASLNETLAQQEKYDRFAKRIGGDAAALRTSLSRWRDRLVARRQRNPIPADNPPGFGRVDALTNIINEVAAGDLGIPENANIANAPVSYPHVWDAPQHNVVQWNGSIPNAGAGPALRNIGEVLGTFGSIVIEPRKGKLPNYPRTTAETRNLNAIEQDLWSLASPLWPEKLSPIDRALASAGKPLYEQHCTQCHLPIERTDPARRVVAQMRDVGSDPTVNQSVQRTVKTGKLAGTPKMLNPKAVFAETDSAVDVLLNATFGAYMAHRSDFRLIPAIARDQVEGTGKLLSLGSFFASLEGDAKQAIADFQSVASQLEQAFLLSGNQHPSPSNQYKGRPLNGIWATGPFLHNGSVPSLTELLKEDKDRVKEFYVGSWTLDTVNVGITSVPEEGGVKHYLFRTNLKGNSNSGHNYGTDLTPLQKKQLIEYIKTL